jgi:hypothetical protein
MRISRSESCWDNDQGAEIKRVEYTIGHDQIAQTVYDAANPGCIGETLPQCR